MMISERTREKFLFKGALTEELATNSRSKKISQLTEEAQSMKLLVLRRNK
jgi:hypothetical protein